jgi:hypothetical protein
MIKYIVVDTETQKHADQVSGGWDNIEGMGFASAVTYSSQLDRYVFWKSNQREDLCKYLNNQLVVSFNGINFDTKLLLGNDRVLNNNGSTENGKYKWFNADLYVEIWRNILNLDRTNYNIIIKKIEEQRFPKGMFDLESIGNATLGMKKAGKGSRAPDLFQQGKLIELFQYNLQDVRVTKSLYEFIRERKYIITGGYDVVSFS